MKPLAPPPNWLPPYAPVEVKWGGSSAATRYHDAISRWRSARHRFIHTAIKASSAEEFKRAKVSLQRECRDLVADLAAELVVDELMGDD